MVRYPSTESPPCEPQKTAVAVIAGKASTSATSTAARPTIKLRTHVEPPSMLPTTSASLGMNAGDNRKPVAPMAMPTMKAES